MGPVYGLGEQAAKIIRAQYNGTPLPTSNKTVSTASGSASPTGSGSQQTDKPNGAASITTSNLLIWTTAALIFGAVMGF